MRVFVIIGLLMTVASSALAVSVSFLDRKGQLITSLEIEADLQKNIGALSVAALERLKAEGKVTDFIASDLGVSSIDALGSEAEIISRSEMRAWGWCFQLNGVVPETYTHQTHFKAQDDELIWYYGYAHYLDGKWITQCSTEWGTGEAGKAAPQGISEN